MIIINVILLIINCKILIINLYIFVIERLKTKYWQNALEKCLHRNLLYISEIIKDHCYIKQKYRTIIIKLL